MQRLLLAILFAALPASAQTGAAQMQGTVTDSSGAVIPGAIAVLENTRTGNRFESTTNAAGAYVFWRVRLPVVASRGL